MKDMISKQAKTTAPSRRLNRGGLAAINVIVLSLDNAAEDFQVVVKLEDTVMSLKLRVWGDLGFPPSHQKIVFSARSSKENGNLRWEDMSIPPSVQKKRFYTTILEDEKSFLECNLCDGAYVFLFLRPERNPTVIQIKYLWGPAVPITVDLKWTSVKTIKEMLAQKVGLPVQAQRLLCSGIELENEQTMGSIKVPQDKKFLLIRDTIFLAEHSTEIGREAQNGLVQDCSSETRSRYYILMEKQRTTFAEQITLKIRYLWGPSLQITVKRKSTTVKSIKRLIAIKLPLPVEAQILLCSGLELEDEWNMDKFVNLDDPQLLLIRNLRFFEECAIKIQFWWRLSKERKRGKHATIIQTWWRLIRERKREKCANCIQNWWRKLQRARKEYEKLRRLIWEKKIEKELKMSFARNDAALRIQSLYRGFRERRQHSQRVHEEKQRIAAIRIQSLYRGFRQRGKNRERKRRMAAVYIQSIYRGYRERISFSQKIRARRRWNKFQRKIVDITVAAFSIADQVKICIKMPSRWLYKKQKVLLQKGVLVAADVIRIIWPNIIITILLATTLGFIAQEGCRSIRATVRMGTEGTEWMWLNVHGFLSENLEATERALAAAVYIGGICIGMVISMSSLFTSQKMSFRGRSPYQKELGDSLLLSVGLRIFRAWRHSLLFAEKIFSLYFYLKFFEGVGRPIFVFPMV
mmetsp:Transcript_13588/g.21713  ORF Transcript_13588/g.21713 Transcript_13588/m.21713 type:complete len:691 (+) Transcript_13588:15-2087(+)